MPKRLQPTTIMVAVDLGTTYSSITWAEACEGTNHKFLLNWPHSAPEFGDVSDIVKVPTEIGHKRNEDGHMGVKWGYQIPAKVRRLQWFKLALDPNGRKLLEEELTLPHRDPRRIKIPGGMASDKPTIDFLEALHLHFLDEFRKKRNIGRRELEKRYNFQYIVTIPGMWTMKSAFKTVYCAKKAGIGSSKTIKVLSEPEAAAFLTLKCYGHEPELQIGNTVIICDAGGGTVDLLTVTIRERHPLRLSESAPGTGSLCGGVFLNRGFEDFLQKKLKRCARWDPQVMQRGMIWFETEKRNFSFADRVDKTFLVPGMADDPEAGVQDGKLKITWEEMEEVFRPIVSKIIALIRGQLTGSQELVDAIILTGRLGQNPYIRERIQESIPGTVKLFSPKNGWAAVSAGALLKGLDGSGYLIEPRMTRENLGISTPIPFDPLLHDKQKMYSRHGKEYVDIMNWFIKKGEVYKGNKIVGVECLTTWMPVRDGGAQSEMMRLEIYSCNTALRVGVDPPRHLTKGIHLEAIVRGSFKPDERVIREWCKLEGGVYTIPYHLIVTYSPTKIEYGISSRVEARVDVQVDQA